MTADPFTEAARAEAKAVMSEARERVGITVQEQNRYVEGRVAGAEWARAYLAAQEPQRKTVLDHWDEHEQTRAAQEPTVAEVLAVRVALADQMPQNWWGGEQWYRYAQEALAAARAARRDEEAR